jgi:hypothetical protein
MTVIYECLKKARVFVPGKPFQHDVMLVGPETYPREECLKGASLGVASDLTYKHWTKLDSLAEVNHSSLF